MQLTLQLADANEYDKENTCSNNIQNAHHESYEVQEKLGLQQLSALPSPAPEETRHSEHHGSCRKASLTC